MKSEKISIESIKEKLNHISNRNVDDRPTVVAYGLMNAGKSFLLNMLTQHIEEEFFKTNDIRETAEIKKFESEKYVYLDTPGLDANQADDAHAQFGASQADVVLFLHQPQGELEANEVKFLKALKQSFGSFAESNIILVLSKIEKEEQAKIDLIEDRIKTQCTQEIGFSPKVFQVSNKRYQTGVIKHKDGLIAQSHINSLIEHLDLVALNAGKVRAQRSLTEVEALLQMIESKEQLLRSKRQNLKDGISKAFSIFNAQTAALRDFLEDSSSEYRNI
ncbi:MAG: GTPase [Hydrogenophaga sp.]|uniref:GTPase n=1 Tax=Hydrogenophaga sp. TaxID=1904254 RepID=UPI002AB8F063|nr:GTPase [Hydrogenophaga sp.]MDZ4189227.1 GTPase [Hydrogenophaga sp.]